MHRICLPWEAHPSRHRCRMQQRRPPRHRTQHLPQPLLHRQQIPGPVPVGRPAIPVSSVQSVDPQSRLQQMDGYAPVAQSTRANSAPNVEPGSLQENLFTSAISVDGNRKIRRILRNSVRNVEIPSTITTCKSKRNNWGRIVLTEVERE